MNRSNEKENDGNVKEGLTDKSDVMTGEIQPSKPMSRNHHNIQSHLQHHRLHPRQRRLHNFPRRPSQEISPLPSSLDHLQTARQDRSNRICTPPAKEKEEKVRQHKRQKRKAKKIAAASAEKRAGHEKQGVIEANGKDTRRGGTSYKKPQDVKSATDGQANVENEEERLEKKMEVGLQKLTVSASKHRIPEETIKIGKDKLDIKEGPKRNAVWDMQWKKDSKIAEIRKPGWFFSGEDVLKDG